MIGPGTKELLFMLQMIDDKKTNLLSPAWVSYANQCDLLGMDYKYIKTTYENKWMFSDDDLKILKQELDDSMEK